MRHPILTRLAAGLVIAALGGGPVAPIPFSRRGGPPLSGLVASINDHE
jgi:hypothetical protein